MQNCRRNLNSYFLDIQAWKSERKISSKLKKYKFFIKKLNFKTVIKIKRMCIIKHKKEL